MGFSGEEIFKSDCDIKYLYQKPKTKSNHLIVIFSAFSRKGQPPAYNYVKTLQNVDAHKLFVLDDYGPSASYYLGGNRDLTQRDSVFSLIKHISEKLNIKFEDIITVGSSKGGYASLYFSIKYGLGHSIVGAPQTAIGNYLFNHAKEVAEYIAGGLSDNDKEFLNGILPEVVKNTEQFPDMNIHIGKGDHHYKGHVLPFIELLDEKKIEYNLDLQEYTQHSEVGTYFPEFLLSTIKTIINNSH